MKVKIALFLAVFATFLGFVAVAEVAATEPTVIIMPSRYTVVQFAFDIARLRRNVYLMTYEQLASSKAPVYHVWDEKKQDWVRIELNDYMTGSIFAQTPKRVILVGSDKEIVSELSVAPSYCEGPNRIKALDVVTLVNSLNKVMDFTKSEWKWLGQRHQIEFKDLNADRRKYGKYGKPGSDITMPEAKITEQEKLVINTVDIAEPKPEVPEKAPEVKPEVKPIPPEDK